MLSDTQFKNSYSSGLDEPKEFFTEALIESSTFDLGLGFFSSSGFQSLSYGFAVFIANGGQMRIVINHILSEGDKKAIEIGQQNLLRGFEEKIISNINRLTETLSKRDHHFFNCLSYLISINRIKFVATTSTKGGLGHDKYGVFSDVKGDKVAFIGSANFSQAAFELNGETITVFSSKDDRERIEEYQQLFNSSWNNETPHLIHIPIDNIKTHIQGKFSKNALKELLQDGIDIREIDFRELSKKTTQKPLSERLKEKIEFKEQEPRFPFPEERDIQKNAYRAWVENKMQGIFAMATGSGKTVTALNCLLKLYKDKGFYKAIIVVPTQALAIQWREETEAFNFQNIVSTHSDKDWRNTLDRYTTRSLHSENKNLIVITTYATFNRERIQAFISMTKGMNSFVYIGDEAHNVGSPTSLKKLPESIEWRIGLSATPERIYDEIGSEKLYSFFNSRPPQYTFRYTMKQAIDDGILCHYDYFPVFVELTDIEMAEYEDKTAKLRKFINPETGKYKPEAEMLLLERKRIIHKAEDKKLKILNLLNSLKDDKKLDYTFVFVPEGYEPDYSENDSYSIDTEDIHIIDEYAEMFKEQGYSYYKFMGGLDDAPNILQNFAKGNIQVLLSMKCLDEGVDIPRAEHAIFCSSTGNPRQFVQRRGRVLRRSKGKEKAKIWDLIVAPPNISADSTGTERSVFISEVKRILNFAALADNQVEILYGELKEICELLLIDMFEMLETEQEQYN